MRKFFDELNEATITGGYPDSGQDGVCTDDDLPTGTTVFGDKMVPVEVPNRLTGKTIKYVPASDLNQQWNYDEFEHSKPMGSVKAYSKTLDDLDGMLGGRLFSHTDRRKFRLHQDKWIARGGNQEGFGIKQTKRLSDDGEKTKEIPVDITEKIDIFLGDTTEREIVVEMVDLSDRRELAKAVMGSKEKKLKIKSIGKTIDVIQQGIKTIITYLPDEEITLALVDIADTMGLRFETRRQGAVQTFTYTK